MSVFEVRRYSTSTGREPFSEWLEKLPDKHAKGRILARLDRLEAGVFGDVEYLRDGVGHQEGYQAMARVSKATRPLTARAVRSVSHRARLIEELRADPELAEGYLNAAAEENDPRVYLIALRTVAEAQGMAKLAEAAGVPRESLYRALSAGGNPRFSTLYAVLKAAGFKLSVQRS